MTRTHPDPSHDPSCFGCKLQTVNLGFTWGRETFHGPTIRELQHQAVAEATAGGLTVEQKPVRQVLI
jgi:hypothetical protein